MPGARGVHGPDRGARRSARGIRRGSACHEEKLFLPGFPCLCQLGVSAARLGVVLSRSESHSVVP